MTKKHDQNRENSPIKLRKSALQSRNYLLSALHWFVHPDPWCVPQDNHSAHITLLLLSMSLLYDICLMTFLRV